MYALFPDSNVPMSSKHQPRVAHQGTYHDDENGLTIHFRIVQIGPDLYLERRTRNKMGDETWVYHDTNRFGHGMTMAFNFLLSSIANGKRTDS